MHDILPPVWVGNEFYVENLSEYDKNTSTPNTFRLEYLVKGAVWERCGGHRMLWSTTSSEKQRQAELYAVRKSYLFDVN